MRVLPFLLGQLHIMEVVTKYTVKVALPLLGHFPRRRRLTCLPRWGECRSGGRRGGNDCGNLNWGKRTWEGTRHQGSQGERSEELAGLLARMPNKQAEMMITTKPIPLMNSFLEMGIDAGLPRNENEPAACVVRTG